MTTSASTNAYSIALQLTGLEEIPGPEHNPLVVGMHQWVCQHSAGYGGWQPVDDETAWCGALVGFCTLLAGLPLPPLALRARSWLQWGYRVPLPEAQVGDLVVFARSGSPLSTNVLDAPGHVGFYAGPSGGQYVSDRDNLSVLGGNQGNSVSTKLYSVDKLLAVQRLR